MGRLYEELEDENGRVTKYRRHSNGRGLVAPTARVDESAFIEATAWVEPEARVGRDSWVGAGSWVDRGSLLGDRTFVGANVHVGEGSVLGAGVRVGSHTKIGRGAVIAPGTRVERDIVIPAGARIGRQGTSVRETQAGQAGRERPRNGAAHHDDVRSDRRAA